MHLKIARTLNSLHYSNGLNTYSEDPENMQKSLGAFID